MTAILFLNFNPSYKKNSSGGKKDALMIQLYL